ncbi:MAG: hypothetical protein NTX71_10945 [Candidatus Aureabacteria bacterium]|nr:hypothetical protein [Candidatus Auribacterota bacterium]
MMTDEIHEKSDLVGKNLHVCGWKLILILSALAGYTMALGYCYNSYFHDDAFITYQYSKNLAEGNGLVFNVGERVLGTSSPFYALLLAVCYPAARNSLPVLSNYMGCLSIAISGFLLFLLLWQSGKPLAGTLAGASICLGMGRAYFHLGLETNFLTAILIAVYYSCFNRRYTLASAIMAVGILTRYDSVTFAIAIFVIFTLREKHIFLKQALICLVLILPWFVFAYYYYGLLTPTALAAKSGTCSFREYLLNALYNIEDTIFMPVKNVISASYPYHPISGIFLLGIMAYGAYSLTEVDIAYSLFLIWPIVQIISYSLIGAPGDQLWHLYPIYPFLIAVYFTGLLNLLGRIPDMRIKGRYEIRGFPVVAGIVIFLYLSGSFLLVKKHVPHYQNSFWSGGRAKQYREVSDWIIAHTPPNASVLSTEVGMIGFYTDRRMIDWFGLITPGLFFHQDSKRTPLDDILSKYSPDYLLLDIDHKPVAAYVRVKEFDRQNFIHFACFVREH